MKLTSEYADQNGTIVCYGPDDSHVPWKAQIKGWGADGVEECMLTVPLTRLADMAAGPPNEYVCTLLSGV